MRISLYELFTLCGIEETDITDNIYDFAVNFGCHIKKGDCKDNYDKLMRLFSTRIECDKFDIETPSMAHCFITDFIKSNINIFDKFMNEYNRDCYAPKSYDDIDDETWYDLYMNTFEGLVIGNYSMEAYTYLYELFGGK